MLTFQRLISLLTLAAFIGSSEGGLINTGAALVSHGADGLIPDKPLLPSVDPFYQPPQASRSKLLAPSFALGRSQLPTSA